MSKCEKLAGCPFFNDKMPNMPNVVEAIKARFCLGDSSGCARYQVGKAGKFVPSDLYPTHNHRVAAIIRG